LLTSAHTFPMPPLNMQEQKMEDESELAKSMSNWKSLAPSWENINSR